MVIYCNLTHLYLLCLDTLYLSCWNKPVGDWAGTAPCDTATGEIIVAEAWLRKSLKITDLLYAISR